MQAVAVIIKTKKEHNDEERQIFHKIMQSEQLHSTGQQGSPLGKCYSIFIIIIIVVKADLVFNHSSQYNHDSASNLISESRKISFLYSLS